MKASKSETTSSTKYCISCKYFEAGEPKDPACEGDITDWCACPHFEWKANHTFYVYGPSPRPYKTLVIRARNEYCKGDYFEKRV